MFPILEGAASEGVFLPVQTARQECRAGVTSPACRSVPEPEEEAGSQGHPGLPVRRSSSASTRQQQKTTRLRKGKKSQVPPGMASWEGM